MKLFEVDIKKSIVKKAITDLLLVLDSGQKVFGLFLFSLYIAHNFFFFNYPEVNSSAITIIFNLRIIKRTEVLFFYSIIST